MFQAEGMLLLLLIDSRFSQGTRCASMCRRKKNTSQIDPKKSMGLSQVYPALSYGQLAQEDYCSFLAMGPGSVLLARVPIGKDQKGFHKVISMTRAVSVKFS